MTGLVHLRPRITFRSVTGSRGRVYRVPDRLRRCRYSWPWARVYEAVLREGGQQDVLTYIDGVLLVDLWDELVLPRDLRAILKLVG